MQPQVRWREQDRLHLKPFGVCPCGAFFLCSQGHLEGRKLLPFPWRGSVGVSPLFCSTQLANLSPRRSVWCLTGRLARSLHRLGPRCGNVATCCPGALLRGHVHLSSSLTRGEKAGLSLLPLQRASTPGVGPASSMAQFLPTMFWARVGPGATFQTASGSYLPSGQSRALTAEMMRLQVGFWDQQRSPVQLFRGAVNLESVGHSFLI